ncbi:phosphotransferase family enzyme [Haloactinospora alba]|uniref:Phosphotransferase family enzyme n=1 Tax=Haloactinospora alba TaxID=405555 RepID=A0A543N7I2_9ACTN|nr:phosphotransferase [Haloactinospora alba]TQN27770.1 phosphotransferase family enzyme [Haloactinospora alba]
MTSSTHLPADLTDRWHQAAERLGASAPADTPLHSGMGGRTLSGPVVTTDGLSAWLRLMVAPKPEGKIWEGAALADALLGDAISRPVILAEHTWHEDGAAFQANLWTRLRGEILSPTPDLSAPAPVDEQWWRDIRACVDEVRTSADPSGRGVMTQAYIDRIPRFIPALEGADLTVSRWEAAHGDLHWANLTRDPLEIIDWEGWGAAPAGYDAAVLLAYALPAPDTAAKVREMFGDMLNTEHGRLAQLVICAEIIQASERDDVHARLKPHAERLADEILALQ